MPKRVCVSAIHSPHACFLMRRIVLGFISAKVPFCPDVGHPEISGGHPVCENSLIEGSGENERTWDIWWASRTTDDEAATKVQVLVLVGRVPTTRSNSAVALQ